MNKTQQLLKEREQAELAIFWQEIADNLPKSIERSALGDEKIFLAFKIAYPKIRNHIASLLLNSLKEEIGGMRKSIKYPTGFNVIDTDSASRIVPNKNYNLALSDISTLLSETISNIQTK